MIESAKRAGENLMLSRNDWNNSNVLQQDTMSEKIQELKRIRGKNAQAAKAADQDKNRKTVFTLMMNSSSESSLSRNLVRPTKDLKSNSSAKGAIPKVDSMPSSRGIVSNQESRLLPSIGSKKGQQ